MKMVMGDFQGAQGLELQRLRERTDVARMRSALEFRSKLKNSIFHR